jgi:hypothetical protein
VPSRIWLNSAPSKIWLGSGLICEADGQVLDHEVGVRRGCGLHGEVAVDQPDLWIYFTIILVDVWGAKFLGCWC